MCKTINILSTLTQCTKELKLRYEFINERISEIDKAQEDILHMIENEEMSASRGYELARALHIIRTERRELKNEYGILKSVLPKIESVQPTIGIAYNRAKELDNKYKRIVENGINSYKPRVIDIEGDIRIEVRNVISKEV